MRFTFLIIVLSIAGCDLFNYQLKPSSQITQGSSATVPNGLVEWCNTLDTTQFYQEPECLWYCRAYSKSLERKALLQSNAKATITTCESN